MIDWIGSLELELWIYCYIVGYILVGSCFCLTRQMIWMLIDICHSTFYRFIHSVCTMCCTLSPFEREVSAWYGLFGLDWID